MKRVVQVWGRPYEVEIEQHSKTVWIAWGYYLGKSLEATGRSEGAALRRWREAAMQRGNLRAYAT